MRKCSLIDPLVSPYVDGELAPADREMLDEHMRDCPPCRSRILAEQSVHDVIAARRDALRAERAPVALRTRCANLAGGVSAATQNAAAGLVGSSPAWRARLAPFALAATLVLIVAAAFLYQLTASSASVMAAELTADHVKCFAINGLLDTHQTSESVESQMASGFDWRMRLPETEGSGLELVGSRPCLYGEGRVAHLMFRHNGAPVSLFMLPHTARSEQLVHVFGHDASVWSVGDRTFVLIARETTAEVERLTTFVRASIR